MAEFEPIQSQEEFDARLGKRLAAEREKWEREAGLTEAVAEHQVEVDNLKAEYEAQIDQLKAALASNEKQQKLEQLERYTRELLGQRGVQDDGRVQRVMKLLDLEAARTTEKYSSPEKAIEYQLSALANDVPELLSRREVGIGAGSGGSRKPVLSPEKPLSEAELGEMSPDEMADPGVMARIDAFLKGEREG